MTAPFNNYQAIYTLNPLDLISIALTDMPPVRKQDKQVHKQTTMKSRRKGQNEEIKMHIAYQHRREGIFSSSLQVRNDCLRKNIVSKRKTYQGS